MSIITKLLGIVTRSEYLAMTDYFNKKTELISDRYYDLDKKLRQVCPHIHLEFKDEFSWGLRFVNDKLKDVRLVARCKDCGKTFTKEELKKAGLKLKKRVV